MRLITYVMLDYGAIGDMPSTRLGKQLVYKSWVVEVVFRWVRAVFEEVEAS